MINDLQQYLNHHQRQHPGIRNSTYTTPNMRFGDEYDKSRIHHIYALIDDGVAMSSPDSVNASWNQCASC
jgi:hypothetical protein